LPYDRSLLLTIVADPMADKIRAVILGIVETDHSCNVLATKHVDKVDGEKCIVPLSLPTLVHRALEGNELARNNLLHVAMLRMVVIEIFLCVEGVGVIEPCGYGLGEAAPTVFDLIQNKDNDNEMKQK